MAVPNLRRRGQRPGPPEAKVNLRALLRESGEVSSIEAVLVGLEVLRGLEAGAGPPDWERIDVSESGEILLDPPAAGSQPDQGDNIRELGLLLCQLLGVPRVPGDELLRAERGAPALVVTARYLAGGSSGIGATAAAHLIRESAGLAASPSAASAARRRLGSRVLRHRSASEAPASPAPRARPGPGPAGRPSPPPTRRPYAAPKPAPRPLQRVPPAGRAPAPAARPAALPLRPAGRPNPAAHRSLRAAGALAALGLILVVAAAVGFGHRTAPRNPGAASVSGPVPAPAASAGVLASTGSSRFVPADSPDEAVRRFFALVAKREYDSAALYWTPRLRDQQPPSAVAEQYRNVTSVDLLKDQVLALDEAAGIANVLVEARVTADGQTYQVVGFMYLATGPNGWRVDQIQLKRVSG